MLRTKVKIEQANHTYSDDEGRPYISCSKFLGLFEPVFNREMFSKFSAKKKGVSQEVILREWDKTRDTAIDHGNRIHNTMEYYAKNFSMPAGEEELTPMVHSIMFDYKEYYQCYSEEVLYTKYGIAGTSDKVLVVAKGKNSSLDVEDFKTNLSKGIESYNKYNKYFLGPISHLHHCNYNKYALQLSMYAYMLEEMLGRNIRALWLRYIPPQDKMQHVRIPVPYLKKEIESMIEYWLDNKN